MRRLIRCPLHRDAASSSSTTSLNLCRFHSVHRSSRLLQFQSNNYRVATPAALHLQRIQSLSKRLLSATKRPSRSPDKKTLSFLHELGYTASVSNGIIDALLQNGITPSSLFSMVKTLAGRYEVDEDGGLQILAASVQADIDAKEGKSKVKVVFLPWGAWSPAPADDENDEDQLPIIKSMKRAFVVEALEGTTLTDVAKLSTSENADVLGEYLECACAGIMACSTCHVVISPEWFSSGPEETRKIAPPCEAELDMIDLAYEPQVSSRLGCQIKLTRELDGLVILLPGGSNNLMDDIPFDR